MAWKFLLMESKADVSELAAPGLLGSSVEPRTLDSTIFFPMSCKQSMLHVMLCIEHILSQQQSANKPTQVSEMHI